MDFNIASFGVNLGIVLGIIFLSQMIKMILSKTKIENKIKKYYVLLPLVLSILGALASTTPLTIQKYFFNVIVYTGAASYLYNGKKLFIKKEGE